MAARFACALPLPSSFRPGDILAFHRRDPQELAERVGATSLQKGMAWSAAPACLTLRFAQGAAEAELAIDGKAAVGGKPAFEAMVRRMLGLTQDVDGFESRYREHPQIGRLIARHPGLRVPLAATPFEALTWAIAGQQISVGAAVSLRRKLIAATGLRHSSGLLCYPEAAQIAALDEAELRDAGFSTAKSQTLLTLARQVAEGRLPLAEWLRSLPVEAMREQLLALRGIGPWTVNYVLLRGFGWLDGSLHGDVAVRRKLQALLDAPEKIGERQAEDWLAQFSPWRALIAAHLWAMQPTVAY